MYISLITGSIEHFLMDLLAIHISSLQNVYLGPLKALGERITLGNTYRGLIIFQTLNNVFFMP